ncbi:unnamed protein product [Medioppia subpectinata]|uniref:Uncharacterized protein n=1 Tax=Medioppia subpectinata TaxID=1979941 RepID=A0A7R9Q6I9_9ACAR|nr:unnamed protein product [Medioppia subpectinata]CAG2114479.1 unnamed protein product [Medioppia subpectinata]
MAYDIVVDNKVEQLTFNKIAVYLSYLNGNFDEINTGTVSVGRCAGDTLFLSNAFVANDQDGCAGAKGVAALTARYISARLTGPKCGTTICTMESGHVTLNPPVRNN